MGTPTPRRNFVMRNMPCVSRTPGSATPIIRAVPNEVLLHEWWLVRAGKHLQLSGFTSRGKQVKEIFHSAPVKKRHGTGMVETVDGITISIFGFINRFRTLENGFSKEVCDKFVLGFPYNWEEFASASDVSPSEANPQSSKTWSSSNYTLPVAFEDFPAVAIEDLLMCIPEDSKSFMLNILVENIRKSYSVNSTGEQMTDCLKEDAPQGTKDPFMRDNQTWNDTNTVELEHTDVNLVPEPTSSVAKGVEILHKSEDGITMAGAGVRVNMNTASEKCLEGSCIGSHASITMEVAGVRENMNTASEKCLGFRCVDDSHVSKTMSTTISDEEGHMGSLAVDFNANKNATIESEGNNKYQFVAYDVPQSCSKTKDDEVKQKEGGRPAKRQRGPENDTSNMRVTRSMKRQKKKSLQNTSEAPDGVTEAVVMETPKKQSHIMSLQGESFPQNTSATTDGVTVVVALQIPKRRKRETFLQETSTTTDGVTAAVVSGTPKKQSPTSQTRCEAPNSSKLSKSQAETDKVKKSQMTPTLRRSSRLQCKKYHAEES